MSEQVYPATENWYWQVRNGERPDGPELFRELSFERQSALLHWIGDSIIRTKTWNARDTSGVLKSKFESSRQGFYITDGQMKGAMQEAGFKAKTMTGATNAASAPWVFMISKRSPGLK